MKELYVKPIFLIEEFVPNKVVAASCETNQSIDDALCFIGTETKTENIIAKLDETTSCSNNVLYYSTATSAYHSDGNGNSLVGGQNYSHPSSMGAGLLVWCASETKSGQGPTATTVTTYSTSNWSLSGTNAMHSTSHDDYKGVHCHVLPVYNSNVTLS